ncbi:MAG TPA: transposase [Candidatus Acidoferrum sp.]
MEKLRWKKEMPEGKRFAEFEKHLDAGNFGPVWLEDGRIAEIVAKKISKIEIDGNGKVHAFAVMPNHVHLLLEPRIELSRIMKMVKGSTARSANKILERSGKYFWQDESFDHWIRNSAEFERVKMYVERNPVKAGLVKRAEEWKWCSAYRLPG